MGVSLLCLGYGGLILIMLPSAHSSISSKGLLVPIASAVYGALTAWILATAWVRPSPQNSLRASQLATVMFLLWAGWNLWAAHSPGSIPFVLLLGTIVIGVVLAAQVGCIRFVSAAQQGVPADGSRPAGEPRR